MKKLILLLSLVFAGYMFVGHKKHQLDTSETITGELVVDFKDDVSPAYIEQLGKRLHIKFRPESSYSAIDKLFVGEYEGSDEFEALENLRADKMVEAADQEHILSIPENSLDETEEGLLVSANDNAAGGKVNDPLRSKQWNMDQINLPDSWATGRTAGEGVVIAILDTGIDESLEDLAETKFVKGYNFVDNNENTGDKNSHGSHVAGTASQSTNNGKGVVGVAYKSILMAVKVLGDSGSGSSAGIAQAIHFVADRKVSVINMSLGGGRYDAVMAKAVKYAHDKGVFIACAVGNSSRDEVSFPAAYSGAVAVAATQRNERTTFYSNWGKEVAISAPGGNVRDGVDDGILQNTIRNGKTGYYSLMGSSMACPHIAGVAALVIGAGVSDPDQVREILTSTARSPKGMEKDKPGHYADHYGAGIVDASAALTKARSSSGFVGQHKSKLIYVAVCLGLLLLLVVVKRKKK